jgi:hypothetical protein
MAFASTHFCCCAAVKRPQDYHQEIQDVMGTAFGVPEDVDEVKRQLLLLGLS